MHKGAKEKGEGRKAKWEIPLKASGQNGLVMPQSNDHPGTPPSSLLPETVYAHKSQNGKNSTADIMFHILMDANKHCRDATQFRA